MNQTRARHASFNRLVKPHFQRLYKVAFHLTGNSQDCEDLLQEFFLKVYQKIDDLEEISPLEPWLMTVLQNSFIDRYRKKTKLLKREINTTQLRGADVEQTRLDPATTVADIADQFNDRDAINRALLTINIEYRVAVVLHDVIGYSIEEMQNIVNAPAGTIKSRIFRARRLLREALSDETICRGDSFKR